jgi:DMSO/TMAO reductase YedYZ molybdopterin-dependent catalytic subunit
MTLPPGQFDLGQFPRFGTHFHRPPPVLALGPTLEVSGAVVEPVSVALTELDALPRQEMTTDFHCVSGWSATGLRWEGIAFSDFYREVVEPVLRPEDGNITHLVFGGLDGFESLAMIEDAMDPSVLLADRLNGEPLAPDHGAPLRLVSPLQYGYMSTKHLSRIEVHTSRPRRTLGAATAFAQLALEGPLVLRHPRARVWKEERHPWLPARLLRPLYRLAIRPGIELGARAKPALKGSRS